MSETEQENTEGEELTEPTVTDVPEPDQDEEAEAEAAESHDPEPEPEPEAQGLTPEQLEAAFKSIGKSFKTYTAAVSRNLEEQANDLLPCPLCEGAIPGFVNRHDAGHVEQETAGAVYAFLNMTPPEALRTSRLNERCSLCGGHGKLITGSLVPQWETKTCDECNGAGFTGPGNPKWSPQVEAVIPNGTESTGEGVNLEFALAAIEGAKGN